MAKMIDSIERVLRGEQPPAPIATLLGFEVAFANSFWRTGSLSWAAALERAAAE